MAICGRLLVLSVRLLVVCSCLLVVCGLLLVVCGCFWSFAGGLWSFVVVTCFSNYARNVAEFELGYCFLSCLR